MTDKTNIEVCIVRDQKRLDFTACIISDKIEKAFQCFPNKRRICHHFIGDPRQFDNILRDRYFGIDKGVEALQYLPCLDLDSTDLGDLAILYRQTCGFNVEYNTFRIKGWIAFSNKHTGGVVHKICFHAVQNLDLLAGLLDIVQGKHCFGKALYVSVVGNRHSRMSPFQCCFNRNIGRNQGIHCRHIGVKMKLYALLGGIIVSCNL